MSGRAAAQGAGAVIAQVVPAPLRAVGDDQTARRRHRQDGHAVVVGAVVDGDRDAGGVRHLKKLGGRAEIERPPAAGVDTLGKAQLAVGVIDGADGAVVDDEVAATVADFGGVEDKAEAAGGDGVARVEDAVAIEGNRADEAALPFSGVKNQLLLAGGGEVGVRGLDLRGRHQFFHQRGDFEGHHPLADGLRQRFDAVILRAVGNVGLAQLARRVGIGDGGVIDADKIGGERGTYLHFDHGADKILARRGISKCPVLAVDADDLDVLLLLRVAALVLTQAIDVADQRQRLAGALVRLDDARSERLYREERHARLNGRDRIGGDALDDVGAYLAVLDAAIEEIAHIGRLGRLADDDVRAPERGGVRAAHARVYRARVKSALGAVNVRWCRHQLARRPGELLRGHQAAAVGGIGQALGGVDFEVLAGEEGFALGHVVLGCKWCLRCLSGN